VASSDDRTTIDGGRMFIYDDGDCGNAWGEEREDSRCPHHSVIYVSTVSDMLDVAAAFMDDEECHLVAITDPNNWSEDQVVLRHDMRRCEHGADFVPETKDLEDLRAELKR
jgi:hypothetical protein